MADQIKATFEHPTGEIDTYFIDIPEDEEETVFVYTSAEKGGPIYTPKHRPAGV